MRFQIYSPSKQYFQSVNPKQKKNHVERLKDSIEQSRGILANIISNEVLSRCLHLLLSIIHRERNRFPKGKSITWPIINATIPQDSARSIAETPATFSYLDRNEFSFFSFFYLGQKKTGRKRGQLNNSAPARTYFLHEYVMCATCVFDRLSFAQRTSQIWHESKSPLPSGQKPLSCKQYPYFSSCF